MSLHIPQPEQQLKWSCTEPLLTHRCARQAALTLYGVRQQPAIPLIVVPVRLP